MAEFAPPPPLTRDDLIALLRRNFPADFIEPKLADPTSMSLLEGGIQMLLRIQAAGDAASEALYTQTAPEGARAVSVLRLRRPSGGGVTIVEGTRVFDSRGDYWRTAEVLVPASLVEQTVDVPVETLRAGHWLNTFLAPTFQLLDPLPDPGLYIIAGPDPAAGGQTDVLALLVAAAFVRRPALPLLRVPRSPIWPPCCYSPSVPAPAWLLICPSCCSGAAYHWICRHRGVLPQRRP